jgi:4-hydroxyacetophenone monooxygenase
VLEKNRDVGGTWLENTYPGCRVDVPNHLYSYSFAPREDWPSQFSDQPALLEYFRRCADDLDLRPLIRFDTEVTAMTWHEDAAEWELHLHRGSPDRGDPEPETVRASVVVSAVGQLNRPRLPEIEGRDDFTGPAFHSARWRHDVDLTGKRVAVIGTGASAAQFVPAIADGVASLTIHQRTPPWFLPTPDYTDPLPEGLIWLFEQIPGYAAWHRLWLFWRYYEGLRPATVVDPEWDGGGRSVSAVNEMVRIVLAQYIEEQFDGEPELLEAVIPDYPPAAKRMIRDDGAWADTLRSDHVDLVTEPIERITPTGVVTADGAEHEADVIVYGTGFTASDFLVPMRVTGRDGRDLHETWGGDATAHLGMTVSGFPNLFLMYGPNTNIVINGSIIYFSECETNYIVDAVHGLLTGPHQSMDVRPEVQAAYAERIDAANRLSAWGASDVNSWYKNEHGRVTQNWPFSLLEFWQQTRAVDPTEYDLR